MTLLEKITKYLQEATSKPSKGDKVTFRSEGKNITGMVTGDMSYGRYKIRAMDGQIKSVGLSDIISIQTRASKTEPTKTQFNKEPTGPQNTINISKVTIAPPQQAQL